MKVCLSLAICACAASLVAQDSLQRTGPAVPVATPVRPAVVTARPVAAPTHSAATAHPVAAPAARPATAVPQAVPVASRAVAVASPVTTAAPTTPIIPASPAESADSPASRASGPPKTVLPPPASDLQIQPSWETQKLARTYVFSIPAPRGQIVDRNGVPLAQSRVSYNLGVEFPSPPQFSDADAARYILEQVTLARSLLKREINVDPDRALKHYKNRGIMPLYILTDLHPNEVEIIKNRRAPGLTLQAAYQRVYPQGSVAGHIVGYVGREGGYSVGQVENNELLWPNSEGRSGIEKSFDEQLTGRPGVMSVTYDAQGHKSSEKVTVPPTPGQTVVLSIDLQMQRLCEDSVKASKRPGAMVLNDCNTGEILAMASIPSFDPNDFIPQISESAYAQLRDDPNHPLLPRAYGSAYPPGSTFKVVTGLAALNEGKVDPEDEFGGEAAIEIGGITFRNWKKTDVGPLNFVQALTQSCNTYFYKMGLKCGFQPIVSYAQRLGLGAKTGILIAGETEGNLMTPDYMMKVYKRRIMPGDIANMSIGQGDTLVTPLQQALMMGSVGNGGTCFQPRLVLQLQGVDDKITYSYDIRVRDQIDIEKGVMKAMRNAMINVVNGSGGTAHVAAMEKVKVAGKTGTAQWGAGKNERVAAWFAGYAPAEKPKYSFAVVYEGKEKNNEVHGGTFAAPIAARVLKEILKPEPDEKDKTKKGGLRKKKPDDEDEEMDNSDEAPVRPKIVKDVDEDLSN